MLTSTIFFSRGASVLSITFASFLWLCLSSVTVAEEVSSFKSRPDLYPPVFTLEVNVVDKLSPGYIFLSPYEAQNPGPYIYDNEGELVWSGWGGAGPGNAHGVHVCKYKGANHLCFFQGNQQKGYCRGHGVILDNQYRIVRSVQPGGGMAASDMHEFLPINDGKTALMTVYQQRHFDMTPWNIKAGFGWVMESVFQEVDIETSEVLFEWRSLDHVEPTLGYTFPDHTDTSGNGLDPHSPWDYFHINSVQKNKAGDYLISSRHTCAVYKISGKDGSIIWTLNGERPSFRNINFSFSQQHDARWLSENSTHTLLSLYNNGFNGYNKTHSYSSGMIILIDHVEKTATQLHDYASPGRQMISSSQGNMQVLPDGHIFMGWGNNAYVSEHDAEGNILLWGYIDKGSIMNYRAQKFEWDGNPTDSPALWTFSKSREPSSPTTFYVSWNGATRVKTWKFYGSQNSTGPFHLLKEVKKKGFETVYTHPDFYVWSAAEALDAEGKVLGKSQSQYTFVPSPELQEFCNAEYCESTSKYGLPEDLDAKVIVPPMGINTVPWIDEEHSDIWSKPYGFNASQFMFADSAPQKDSTEQYGVVYKYMVWAIPILGAGGVVIGGYFAYRRYYRQQKLERAKSNRFNEAASQGPRKRAMNQRSRLPWWNWRRWRQTQRSPHYFALTDQGRESGEYIIHE